MPSDEMVEKARNRIWFDTEFIEDGRTIDLLAIGLVREDGATYYAEPEETDRSRACEWVRDNVLPHLTGPTKPRAVIAAEIVEFVGASPEFWGYYADYDWVALCQLYGRMVDLPKGWPMFCRDLKQVAGDRKLIPQTTTEHNALTDAIWTKEAHAALAAAEAGEPVATDDRKIDAIYPSAVPVAWEDIASAPKDGTWVLLKGGEPDEDYDFDAPKPPCVVAQWVDVSYSDGRPGSGRWYFARYDSGYYGRWHDPTHWRSVASPPSEASRDEREKCADVADSYQEQCAYAMVAEENIEKQLVLEAKIEAAEAIATAIRARGET